jgi:hypothetical protein
MLFGGMDSLLMAWRLGEVVEWARWSLWGGGFGLLTVEEHRRCCCCFCGLIFIVCSWVCPGSAFTFELRCTYTAYLKR